MPLKPQTTKRQIKYTGLVEHVKNEIAAGKLKAGDRLPPFSELREQFGVTPNTVSRALGALESDGLVVREQGRGVFVAKPKPRAATKIIGFIGRAFEQSHRFAYFAQLVRGIREASQREGFEILLLSEQSSVHWEKIDGLLIGDASIPFNLKEIPLVMPHVSLLLPRQGMASVTADDFGGARLATEHLIELGHRRIACLRFRQRDHHSDQRVAGYQAALRDAGIEPDERWMHNLAQWDPQTEMVGQGRKTIAEWLQDDWHDLGCTALFAYNDAVAIGALEAFKVAGVKVPEQVSVIGFDGVADDSHWASRLTTVEVPLHRMGSRAVELLLRQIRHDTEYISQEVLPTKLRVLSTTAPSVGK